MHLRTIAISDVDGDTQGTIDEWSSVALATDAAGNDVDLGRLEEIIVEVDMESWIIPTPSSSDPIDGDAGGGVMFKPNLNLKLPARGCTHVHFQAVNSASTATITLSAIVRI